MLSSTGFPPYKLSVSLRFMFEKYPILKRKDNTTAHASDIPIEQDEQKLLGLCQELNQASRLPWVLLSAGVGFDSFKKQVAIACKAGASGFLAGRALWQEGAQIRSREERMNFFQNTAAPRLEELAELADSSGKPWYSRLGAQNGKFAPVSEGWYRSY